MQAGLKSVGAKVPASPTASSPPAAGTEKLLRSPPDKVLVASAAVRSPWARPRQGRRFRSTKETLKVDAPPQNHRRRVVGCGLSSMSSPVRSRRTRSEEDCGRRRRVDRRQAGPRELGSRPAAIVEHDPESRASASAKIQRRPPRLAINLGKFTFAPPTGRAIAAERRRRPM